MKALRLTVEYGDLSGDGGFYRFVDPVLKKRIVEVRESGSPESFEEDAIWKLKETIKLFQKTADSLSGS